ncbi:proton-conducting transporter membrane subunit [Halorubellus sp. PRR65]|uniref:complex I subunit 5 family protein n=1 Tax=Halorubellus sp. PRR65 TaxID=3098148 RepID=UPI002B256D73|nr:proton-conducting transporter membrane subunit [Halorubellus sp. PRR65]
MSPPVAVIAPLLVVLATAILTAVAHRSLRVQRALSLVGGVGYLGAVAVLFARVKADGTLVYQLSDWRAPYGISLVADDLSVFMLAFGSFVGVAALVFAIAYVDEVGQRVSFHPLYHFMLVGVTGSFLTGDIFNLFVWFEVMLMSSYVLVVFYSGPEHTRAALQYVVLNLVGSALMLVAIGGLYATTGTLNMADLARRLADPSAFGITTLAPVLGLSVVLFVVFALKAGIVPFHWWVPAAYRAAPAPVSAALAGVVKKVGIYAIIRLYFTVFAPADLGELALPGFSGSGPLAYFGPVLLVMATASILLGGVAAVNREDIDDLLAYSSVGQVGFIVLPLALAAFGVVAGVDAPAPYGDVVGASGLAVLGVTAALVYSLNHGLAKSALFLASGVIHDATGTTKLDRLGGLAERAPVLSGGFFVAAIGLVGIPPLVGFFGKFLVFDAAVVAGSEIALGGALAGAVLTITYVTRAWNRGFWGTPTEVVDAARTNRTQVAVVVVLAVAVVGVGIAFDPVLEAAIEGAEAALDTQGYVDAVNPDTTIGATGGGGHA